MNHDIWMEVKTKNTTRLLLKIFKQNINIKEISYTNDGILIKISEKDIKACKKIPEYKFKKKKESGIFTLLDYLKKQYLIVVGIIMFCLCIFFFSSIIVKVEVIHSNKEIRELVTRSLEEYGIKKLTLKKEFKEIEKIKEEILNTNRDKLEWLEIEKNGMKYIVRIEERIIKEPIVQKERCNLVATKSSIVKKMLYQQGEALVSINDFVKEGDILVTGQLIWNEEQKGTVCATGEILGEVWYTTKISLPLNYEEKEETGKTRWNFAWEQEQKKGLIFRPRLTNYIDEKTTLFRLFGTEISFLKQKEVTINQKKYSEEEALTKALSLIDEKFKQKLNSNEEIIDKKVLKKQVNNSTIELEVFVSVIENISRQEEFQEMKEEG